MLSSDPSDWPPLRATVGPSSNASPYSSVGAQVAPHQQQQQLQQLPEAYQQQSPWQSPGAAAHSQGCCSPGLNVQQSLYPPEAQQQLLQSLAAWPGGAPAPTAARFIGDAGSPYLQQQQGFPVSPGPGMAVDHARFQQQQQAPYMAVSVAAQPNGVSSINGPGSSVCVAGTAASQPWGMQPPGRYGAEPQSAISSVGAGGFMAPVASSASQWGREMGNPAWGSAAAGAGANPDAKALQAKAKKDAYRAELEAQIRDKAARKAAEKSALAAADARKEAEMAGYSPWGRGGAGAPLRDASGQVSR